MNKRLTVFTKRLLDVMYYAMMVGIVTLPWLLKAYEGYDSNYHAVYLLVLPVFIVSGILSLLIIGQLRRMMATVLADDCFQPANVTSLRLMGTYSFLIAAVYAIRIFVYPTLSVAVIIIVFLVAGLFSKVLAQVFARAVAYKNENDLTI